MSENMPEDRSAKNVAIGGSRKNYRLTPDAIHSARQAAKAEFLPKNPSSLDEQFLFTQQTPEEIFNIWTDIRDQRQALEEQKEQFAADFETRSIRLHDREIKLGMREKNMSERFAEQQEEFDALRTEQLKSLDEERKRLRREYESLQQANEEITKKRETLEKEQLHQAKEYQDLLEKNAADYVEQTLKKLDSRLKVKSVLAYAWQACGAIALVAGFVYFSYLTTQFDPLEHALDWTDIGYLSFRGALLAGLILGLARYASGASKLLRTEAVKIEDRMHTINYGAFYLKTYGANADWEQVKEAFEHWNTVGSNVLNTKAVPKTNKKISPRISSRTTRPS